MLTHIDLFSGIGGFAVAAGWAGFTTRLFCEIDPYCQKVLAHHWPDVPIHDDVQTLTREKLREYGIERVDLITGGFPCQPVSVAGERKGAEDARWLWYDMYRTIIDCDARWACIENVRGLLTMGHEQVCTDLEEAGYEVGTLVLPAVGINAPHKRDRTWIVAHR